MRRSEFQVTEEKEMEEFLGQMSFGFLGTISEDGWPHVTPINYVYYEGDVYIHGSKIGEKMDSMKQNNQVTFCVAKEYAIIPSYFTDPTYACPATTFFKSVFFRGKAVVVEDVKEKASVMSAFAEKLQPEGGYDPIDANNDEYVKRLRGIAVVKIATEWRTAKFKFGQNYNDPRRQKVIDGLAKRDDPLDEETIRLMKKYCPHHADLQ